MAIQILNDSLDSTASCAVQMPFAPQKISCTDALIWADNGDRYVYASIVRLTDKNEWAIYEFHQPIMDALEAYRFRNGGVQQLEFMLSRYGDGELRISLGRNNLRPVADQVPDEEFRKIAQLSDRLNLRYAKLGASGEVRIRL